MAKEDEAAGRPYRWLSSADLRWLVRLGYAEERVMRGVHVPAHPGRRHASGTGLEPAASVSGYGISGMAGAEISLTSSGEITRFAEIPPDNHDAQEQVRT